MDRKQRAYIKVGQKVRVVQKQDQRSGKLTERIVSKILTNSRYLVRNWIYLMKRARVSLEPLQELSG